MNKNLTKSELRCVASKLLEEELETEDLDDNETIAAVGSLTEDDIRRILSENTIATTQLSN